MMSRYRGQYWSELNMSAFEEKLLIQCHLAADRGDLKQRPFTGIQIRLGKKFPWSRRRVGGVRWRCEAVASPDQYYARPAQVVVYVDGPHHRRGVHPRRDYDISMRLLELGWMPHRIKTETTTVKKALDEIVNHVNARVDRYYDSPFEYAPQRRRKKKSG